METQGADRAESGSRWAEFHENLAYRMFNLVRKQNFGSKSHSGSENVVFFDILGHIKKIIKNSKNIFWNKSQLKWLFDLKSELLT